MRNVTKHSPNELSAAKGDAYPPEGTDGSACGDDGADPPRRDASVADAADGEREWRREGAAAPSSCWRRDEGTVVAMSAKPETSSLRR